MSNLQQFVFNNQSVRIVSIDGEPWFVAQDVCNILDLDNVSKALSRLDDDEVKQLDYKTIITLSNDPNVARLSAISESGLYSLTLSSRKPQAKDFKRWVTKEILPSIRKTGSYSVVPQQSLVPFWYQRLMLDLKTNPVPNGYFSIFREVIPLVADLETAGYVLPDNAVPDISVGKTWANYLKSQGVNINAVARQYPHTYPDKRGTQNPNCYPESMLPMFRQWFREKYKVDHLYQYLKNKDHTALPAVDRIVKALMAG
jgi:hypothetical protein